MTHVQTIVTKLALCAGVLCSAACGDASNDANLVGSLGGDASGSGASSGAGASGTSGGAAGDVVCSESYTSLRRLWRLTPQQYDNTVRDLVGLDGEWGDGFPAGSVVEGFSNNAELLVVSPLLADKLRDAAEDIAARVPLATLAPCAAAQTDAACMQTLVEDFGARAFRRPLTPEDVTRYTALAATESDFEAGARLVVTAMLQSPHFVYRRELGVRGDDGRYVLDDFEVASELSYLLWQSMPDDALFEAARAGALHTPAQIATATERMLAAPAARPMVRDFVLEWLGLASIPTVPKDLTRFPELTAEVRAAMLREAERFVEHVVFDRGSALTALLTARTTFLDDTLADLYGADVSGAPASADGVHAVELSAQERAGILTLGGAMMLHARSNDSSPVHRGRLVRERLLCQTLEPPPPGIVVQPPPMDPTKTTRERYAAHSSVQPCVGCHVLMDPIGLAFERFDGIGRYRSDDNGLPIDVSGEIVQTDHTNTSFEGSEELAEVLASSPDVRACMATQWLRFAYGLHDDARSRCVTEPLVEALAQSDVTLGSLVRGVTAAEHLRVRVSVSDEGAGAGAGGTGGDADAGTGTAGSADANAGAGGATGEGSAGEGGAGEGGSAGTQAPVASDAGSPGVPDTLSVELAVNNDYGSGYCHTYQLTNTGSEPITWQLPLELGGTLMQHWESEVSGDSGSVVFRGATHNRSLAPGTSTQFGFCVTR